MTPLPPIVVTLRKRKPYEPKPSSISLDELRARLGADGVDVRLEQRYRPGKSEVITLRFPDAGYLRFEHRLTNAKDPDAVRRAVLTFVDDCRGLVGKAIDMVVAKQP